MPVQFPAPAMFSNQFHPYEQVPMDELGQHMRQPSPQPPMDYRRPERPKDFADKHVKMTGGCAPVFGTLGGAAGPIASHYGLSNAVSWGASLGASHPAVAVAVGSVALLAAGEGGGGDCLYIGGGESSGSCNGAGGFLVNSCLVTPSISMPAGALGHVAADMAAAHGLSFGAAAGIGAATGCATATVFTAAAYGIYKSIVNCKSTGIYKSIASCLGSSDDD